MTPEQIAANIMDEACLPEPLIKNGVDRAIRASIATALREARNQTLEEAADLVDNYDGPKAPATWSLEEQYAFERGNIETCNSLPHHILALKHKDGQP